MKAAESGAEQFSGDAAVSPRIVAAPAASARRGSTVAELAVEIVETSAHGGVMVSKWMSSEAKGMAVTADATAPEVHPSMVAFCSEREAWALMIAPPAWKPALIAFTEGAWQRSMLESIRIATPPAPTSSPPVRPTSCSQRDPNAQPLVLTWAAVGASRGLGGGHLGEVPRASGRAVLICAGLLRRKHVFCSRAGGGRCVLGSRCGYG